MNDQPNDAGATEVVSIDPMDAAKAAVDKQPWVSNEPEASDFMAMLASDAIAESSPESTDVTADMPTGVTQTEMADVSSSAFVEPVAVGPMAAMPEEADALQGEITGLGDLGTTTDVRATEEVQQLAPDAMPSMEPLPTTTATLPVPPVATTPQETI